MQPWSMVSVCPVRSLFAPVRNPAWSPVSSSDPGPPGALRQPRRMSVERLGAPGHKLPPRQPVRDPPPGGPLGRRGAAGPRIRAPTLSAGTPRGPRLTDPTETWLRPGELGACPRPPPRPPSPNGGVPCCPTRRESQTHPQRKRSGPCKNAVLIVFLSLLPDGSALPRGDFRPSARSMPLSFFFLFISARVSCD